MRRFCVSIVVVAVVVVAGCGGGGAVEVVFNDAVGEGEGDGEGEGEGAAAEGEGEGDSEDVGEGEGEVVVVVEHAARYGDAEHSPLSRSVVEGLRAIRAAHGELHDDVFAKVGASNTVNTGFVTCFDGNGVDFAGHDVDGALDETRAMFSAGDAAGASPWDRVSSAATVGWSAFAPMQGSPRPVDVEVEALAPAFAVVMFGTNDIQLRNITRYADDMLALTDALLARGVIPLISSVPPRDDDASADVEVPRYALVARMVAEARQVPFMDLNRVLRPLPDHGVGSDGIHMNADPRGACHFDDDGLGFGFNRRNLLTLEALDAVRRTVVDGEDSFDDAGPARRGTGTAADPIVVDQLPFTATSTTTSMPALVDAYDCSGADEGGPEVEAIVTLDAPGRLHALVFDQGDVDVDVHVLAGDHCLGRNDKEVALDVDAGTYRVVYDTFVGDAHAGDFQTVVYVE